MSRPLSRSDKLITEMEFVALTALSQAVGGTLSHSELMLKVERGVTLDAWATETYESSGNVRWRSIFAFSSVGLVKAKYVEKSRGIWTITEEGRASIAAPFDGRLFLQEIDRRYRIWKAESLQQAGVEVVGGMDPAGAEADLSPPEERLADILNRTHQSLAAELIETIKECTPDFFERLVVQLLLKMGYGGSRQEAGEAVGRTGDGGIDGVISEDRLGLDAIYLQAKRWEGSVGEGPIRDFKGALDAKGAHKGVFITTSTFTPAAIQAARTSRSYKIVLIDGQRLAALMIEHKLGVSPVATYELQRLDIDFFNEE
jgi:restriction system protein